MPHNLPNTGPSSGLHPSNSSRINDGEYWLLVPQLTAGVILAPQLTVGVMPGELQGSHLSPRPGFHLHTPSYQIIVGRVLQIWIDIDID